MKTIIYFIYIIFFFTSVTTANENNYFLILKNNKVNVRYCPDLDCKIKYVYRKINLPVKVIDKKENFRRIIDLKKNSGWIHHTQLKKGKSFILLEDQILFSRPTIYSKPIIKISIGRLLLVKKCKNRWCKIKTKNYSGWIKTNNIWGIVK